MNAENAGIKVVLFSLGILQVVSATPSRAQALGDEHWDGRFAVAGIANTEGRALAMAFAGTNIYIGGTFQAVGRTVASSLVRFDGQTVEALPDGPRLDLQFVKRFQELTLFLLNPAHPDFKKISIGKPEPFAPRLLT